MFKLKNDSRSTGQALVEFALIAVVLLMMIFLIIEAARIMWAWGTVQNAAREGARYAITGQLDREVCAVDSLEKFKIPICDELQDFRVASVISRTHNGLTGIPLNETSGAFEDDEYYQIEVWGGDLSNQIRPNFAGVPNGAVIVRAYYRVPIITPFFRPILPSIPVFGQTIMYNESFGQLGSGSSEGAALPPPMEEFPTAGPTPSPTFTPTPGIPTLTPTTAATATATPNVCRVKFDGAAVAGNNFVYVTGEIGTLVRILNLTTGGQQISTVYTVAGPFDGHACPGFIMVFLDGPLIAGHTIAVESNDGSQDITFVLPGTPTPTPTHTSTATPTPLYTSTPTPVTPPATATPQDPYIVAVPSCGSLNGNNQVTINLLGYNWPNNKDIIIYWQTAGNIRTTIPSGHGGSFIHQWTENQVTQPASNSTNVYTILAVTTNRQASTTYKIPCDNATAVPTSPATSTPTPAPADLIIVGPPQLETEGDIIGYRPVQFSVVISNTGDVDVNNQFFVDLYLDPSGPVQPDDVRIPVEQSSGYAGVSALPGNTSRVITITAPFGFANEPDPHSVYGMVDSIEQIGESVETNNISIMATADYVTPGPTPTPSPTPPPGVGDNTIVGIVNWSSPDGLDPLHRALVTLYNSSGIAINFTQADANGFYQFTDVPGTSGDVRTYTVTACGNLDGDRYGLRTGVTIPDLLPVANIFTVQQPCP